MDSLLGPTRTIKKKERLVEGVVEEREFLEGGKELELVEMVCSRRTELVI